MPRKQPAIPARKIEPIVVTYSELDAFRQCPLKHQLSYVKGWREEPKIGTPLARGSLWHNAMEIHYTWLKRNPNADLKQIREFIGKHLLVDSQTGEQNEDQRLIEWMLEGHHQCYAHDTGWELVEIEQAHRVRLGPPNSRFFLQFKIDLLVRDKKANQLWLVDHKCLPTTTPVMTPDGERYMGQLKVGDEVLGSNGQPVRVLTVTRTRRPTLMFRLRNGQQIQCSPEHRWPIFGSHYLDRAAKDLAEGDRLLSAPAIELPTKELVVNPYLFGALLGDGSFSRRGLSFTKVEPVVVQRVMNALPSGTSVQKQEHPSKAPTYTLKGTLPKYLQEGLGITTMAGDAKYVPECYFRGSFKQRLELLRGLMDTDGSHRKGVPLYQTGSYQLALDVARLVQSLGGVPTIWCNKRPKYQSGAGKPNWEIKMRFPRDFPAVGYHPEKLKRWKMSTAFLSERLTIESVEELPIQDMIDIEVASDDRLFIVQGVLTHNSARDFSRKVEIDIDDQFGLYSWGLRQLGVDVMGTIRSDARTARNKTPMAMDQRFRRVHTFRTQVELNRIAADAYDCARSAYSGARVTYSAPAPDRCAWRCSYLQAHLMMRKGFEMDQALVDFGFRREVIKHREYAVNPLLDLIP